MLLLKILGNVLLSTDVAWSRYSILPALFISIEYFAASVQKLELEQVLTEMHWGRNHAALCSVQWLYLLSNKSLDWILISPAYNAKCKNSQHVCNVHK